MSEQQKSIKDVLSVITYRISAKAERASVGGKKKRQGGGVGGFPGQQTKRKTITEALKIYSVHFAENRSSSISLSPCLPESLCTPLAQSQPNPPLYLHLR